MHNNLGVRRPRFESQLFLQLAIQTGVNHVPFHKILPSFVEYQDSSFILQLLPNCIVKFLRAFDFYNSIPEFDRYSVTICMIFILTN